MLNSTKTDSANVAGVGDAVWQYMTSLKTVQKADGRQEDFSREKLRNGLLNAFHAAGMKDDAWADRVLELVVGRLTRVFDGHTVPKTADIRELINLTLIDQNLIHVAKKYMQARYDVNVRNGLPRYGHGLTWQRYFTTVGKHPHDLIKWENRTAKITNEKGETVFEQTNVEVPDFWSQTATNIVVQKYFRGKVGHTDRETSVKQLISRVAVTMADWGRADGYFQSAMDAEIFEHELTHILVHQMAAFNSPVWFNVGINPHPQCSACFINSVQDDMRSILNLCVTEGMIFKGGSGSGVNLSRLRSSKEFLGGSNGRSSGPISFMKGLDAFAGVIKSGGKTRRAAKMVILNIEHPDVEQFIKCKVEEEKKAWTLVDAGYDASLDGPAYASIYFQNANNSVRVSDDFLNAVKNDGEWATKEVTTGKPSVKYKARELMQMIGDAAWQCGDPGMQYDTTINKWHTCKNTDRIHASNPCSEYMFLDDTACNLSSLNLMRFRKPSADGKIMEFDVQAFAKASRVMITAMEIAVGNSSYPTPAIEQNSHDYRPLGIGYANLGALLMSRGMAYDSEEARNFSAAITSLLSGETYDQSALIAEKVGPFNGYKKNAEPCMEVMRMHRDASYKVADLGVPADLQAAHRAAWEQMVRHGEMFGVRNSQISVIAPTGTISFLMDCDTTGIEPDIALVKYKWLVGGGMIKIVNQTVPEALTRLGYTDAQVADILKFIDEKDTLEGAPHMKDEHLPVFDCAFKAKNGTRSIHYMGHIRMMAAVQPFVSGAISKTVNMPQEVTPKEVIDAYMEGARLGLKAIAIYRDGSKRQQPLTTSKEKDPNAAKSAEQAAAKVAVVDNKPRRRRLPDERRAVTHKFNIGSHEGYITVGLYDDGKPGEMFITMAKEGSVVSGLMDSFATTVSIALQYGVPLNVLVNKFVHMRFEPSGYTGNEHIRIAKSIVDYIFRWMALKFLTADEQRTVGVNFEIVETEPAKAAAERIDVVQPAAQQANIFAEPLVASAAPAAAASASTEKKVTHTSTFDNQSDAPACETCGSIMVRNAACYKCLNCGSTSGCS